MNVAWFTHAPIPPDSDCPGLHDQNSSVPVARPTHSGQNRERPRWKPEPPFGFGKLNYGNCAAFGDFIEIGQHFDLIMVCAEKYA